MFKLWFRTDNAAFNMPDECARESARILREAADMVDDGRTTARVIDNNGNTVGVWDMHSID